MPQPCFPLHGSHECPWQFQCQQTGEEVALERNQDLHGLQLKHLPFGNYKNIGTWEPMYRDPPRLQLGVVQVRDPKFNFMRFTAYPTEACLFFRALVARIYWKPAVGLGGGVTLPGCAKWNQKNAQAKQACVIGRPTKWLSQAREVVSTCGRLFSSVWVLADLTPPGGRHAPSFTNKLIFAKWFLNHLRYYGLNRPCSSQHKTDGHL